MEINDREAQVCLEPRLKPFRTNFSKFMTGRRCTLINVLPPVVALAISGTALVLALKIQPTRSGSGVHQVNSSKYLICVQCKRLDVGRSPEQLKLLAQVDRRENGTKCCAREQTQLKVLFELVMLRTKKAIEPMPPVINPRNCSMSGASVHKKLTLSSTENIGNYPYFHPGYENHPLYFASDEITPLLEHIKNVDVRAKELRIIKPGIYLVYCSVAFRPDSAMPCHTFAQKTWSVNVTRVRVNDNIDSGVLLLSAKHTCCDDCVMNHETSYTAGVFMLKENDDLYVYVSGEGLVSFKPQSTFFGLAMLSDV